MYYGEIKNCDIADGVGVRISLFVSGCRNHCPGCFQPETWNFEYGKPYTAETQEQILEMLAPEYIDGLTLLGGDPFEPENQRELLPLIRECRKRYPGKNIWAYTGYLYEDLMAGEKHPCCECTKEMVSSLDVLVDGPFREELKDLSLQFRGSRNQRLINVPETLKQDRIVLLEVRERGNFYG